MLNRKCFWISIGLSIFLVLSQVLFAIELNKQIQNQESSTKPLPSLLRLKAVKILEKPTKQVEQDQHVNAYYADKDQCQITYDNGEIAYYMPSFGAGDGFAVYFDPATCGPDPYPFAINSVQFTFYGFEGAVWPVEIQIRIRDMSGSDVCNGPGNLLHSTTRSCSETAAWPNWTWQFLIPTCPVSRPFFVEIVYTGGTSSPYPSLLMTDETNAPDTCTNWLLWGGYYYEWSEAWGEPTPGRAIIRVGGYTRDAGASDSVKVACVDSVCPGDKPNVQVMVSNSVVLDGIVIPLSFGYSGLDVVCDSVSLAGSRLLGLSLDYFLVNIDNTEHKVMVVWIHPGYGGLFYPGSGLFATLYFSAGPGWNPLNDVEIDTTFFPPSNRLLYTVAGLEESFRPAFKPGCLGRCGSTPTVTVTSPDGGENWCVGENYNITWTSQNFADNVKIRYSTNNGGSWQTITASTPNDGTHPWTIPDSPSSNCLVEVSDAIDGDPYDRSNSTFTILDCATEWTVRLDVAGPDRSDIRYFGAHPSGTDGFDNGLDSIGPPSPPGFCSYFWINAAPPYDQVVKDIRSSQADTDSVYLVINGNSPISSFSISWDPATLPSNYGFKMADSINMKIRDSAVFCCGNLTIKIKFWKTGDDVRDYEEDFATPNQYALFQNYPNPFNPSTNIEFVLFKSGQVEIEIFNILGQKVRTLVNSHLKAGHKVVDWDGKDDQGREVTSGLYFYRIQAGDFVESKKMLLLK